MAFWEAVVLIVLIGAVARVMQARYQAQAAAPPPADSGDAARAELAQLRERIQVLERVVTDGHGGRELDRAIERLRERREDER